MAVRHWRRGTRPLLVVLAAAAAAAVWYAQALRHAERWNAAIAAGEGFEVVARMAPAASAASAGAEEEGASSASSPPSRAPSDAIAQGAGSDPARPTSARAAAEALAEPASAAASGAEVPAWLRDGRPLAWRFAHARHLAEHGDLEGALARYRSLYDEPELGLFARYNSGNALLRAALEAREGGHAAQALVLLELAKEAYRGVLRIDPMHWDARYNLERVQRLQPDPTAEDLSGAEPPKPAERAATTMRGTSRGMP